jgi:D-tyrosyl-tRNA(Tyr) deacylase
MKAVVQRVKMAKVTVDDQLTGSIEKGFLVYLGVAREDSEKDVQWMADKIANLRIFSDAQGKMNLSIPDLIELGEKNIGVLAVSQFTLLGECAKGRRPYYGEAAEPEIAKKLYESFIEKIRGSGIECQAGIFQAHMEVHSINDGPVTILLNSREQAR